MYSCECVILASLFCVRVCASVRADTFMLSCAFQPIHEHVFWSKLVSTKARQI